jgi:hypothetical protein
MSEDAERLGEIVEDRYPAIKRGLAELGEMESRVDFAVPERLSSGTTNHMKLLYYFTRSKTKDE